MKQINPEAQVAVKLVSTAGVGTIAAGVAKCYADRLSYLVPEWWKQGSCTS